MVDLVQRLRLGSDRRGHLRDRHRVALLVHLHDQGPHDRQGEGEIQEERTALRPAGSAPSMVPPRARTAAATTSSPTPLPASSDTCSAVEKPGWKISALGSLSFRRLRSAPAPRPWPGSAARSSPRPSSASSITTRPERDTAAQAQHALGGLARRPPLGGRLDPMHHGVGEQVQQRLAQPVEHRLVERRLTAARLQADPLALAFARRRAAAGGSDRTRSRSEAAGSP